MNVNQYNHYNEFKQTTFENPNQNYDMISVDYQDSPKWCTVTYYELNSRVGEEFNSTNPCFFVDGFLNPDIANMHNSRFSLGHLSNIHRNSAIEKTRKNIGKGWY